MDFTMQEAEKRISSFSGIFTEPPQNIPSRTITDAPLLGNGDIGVAMGGDGEKQVYYLGKNDFWMLAHAGETEGQRLDRLLHDKGRRTGTHIVTFGQLIVETPALKGCSYYVKQDIYRGRLEGRFEAGTAKLETGAFVSGRSGGENLLVVSFRSNEPMDITVSLSPGEYGESEVFGYADIIDQDLIYVTYSPNIQNVPDKRRAAAAVKAVGAEMDFTDGLYKAAQFHLEPGKSQYLVTAVASDLDADHVTEAVCSLVRSMTPEGIAERKQAEEAWWESYYAASAVYIEDPVILKYYYQSLYLLGCCTRGDEPIPGLFGNWITTDHPSWTGSYTLNYNYESPFWELETANHSECAASYPDTLLKLIPLGKAFAQHFLGKKGIYLPVEIGPFGTICSMLYHNQRTNAAYACVNLIRHFYYTWDLDYAEKVYPFLQGTAEFWEDYLVYENGRYVIYDDCVHEEYISTQDKNSMMALSLVRYLFQGITVIAEELERDTDKRGKWAHILEHLSGYTVFERNGKEVFRYTESGTEWKIGCPVTIQSIYPLGMFGIYGDFNLRRIAKNTFEERNDWEDDNKFCSFFAAGARIGHDSTDLLIRLRSHCEKFGQANGFIKHRGGGIENCNGVLSCLHEMMLQSYEGVLRFFPNWPKEQNAAFYHLRAEGAFLVSGSFQDTKTAEIEIISEKGRPCVIQIPWPEGAAIYRNGVLEQETDSPRIVLQTVPGDTLRLERL